MWEGPGENKRPENLVKRKKKNLRHRERKRDLKNRDSSKAQRKRN